MKTILRVSEKMRSKSMLTAAKAYIQEWNAKVVMVHGINEHGGCTCRKKDCPSPGKHPITEFFPKGVHSATRRVQAVRDTLEKYPNANVAIALEGLTVVDIDGPEGKKTVTSAQLKDTALSFSGRGSRLHYKGELPGGTAKGKELDLLTDSNHYVVMPPSRHANGKNYRWGRRVSVVASLDASVSSIAKAFKRTSAVVKVDFEGAKGSSIREGGRNSYLTRIGGMLRYAGMGPTHLPEVLEAINDVTCNPPLERGEVETIAASICRYGSTFDEAFVTLSDVEEEDVHWLLEPYIPKGALTVLDGDPGQGKSFFCAALAAAISSGKKLPFAKSAIEGHVVMLSAEDSNSTILKPRIIACGGNPEKIHAQSSPFTLDVKGLSLLRAELEKRKPVLVIIDPITAYMGASLDMYRANDTTEFLVAVEALAREFDCAILIVRHLKKSSGDIAIYRGIGSIAVTARVRSGLILGRDPNDVQMRAVAQIKSNYGEFGPTILFDLKQKIGFRQPKVVWQGTTTKIDGEAILARPPADRGRPNLEREEAKTFLKDALSDGPLEKSRIIRMAEARSISEMTLRRAAEELGVTKGKKGKISYWTLPDQEDYQHEEAA